MTDAPASAQEVPTIEEVRVRRVLPGLVFAVFVGVAVGWAVSTRVGVIVAVVVAVGLLPLLDRSDRDR